MFYSLFGFSFAVWALAFARIGRRVHAGVKLILYIIYIRIRICINSHDAELGADGCVAGVAFCYMPAFSKARGIEPRVRPCNKLTKRLNPLSLIANLYDCVCDKQLVMQK